MTKAKMKMFLKQPSFRVAAAAGLATVAGVARADGGGIDTSQVISAITAAGVACGAVGAAYLVAVVGIKGFKLIRSAL